MKTILITGAAGFIGSHLCDFFLKQNKVIGIDNFITGSRKNISYQLDNENFTFIEHDICKQLKNPNKRLIIYCILQAQQVRLIILIFQLRL